MWRKRLWRGKRSDCVFKNTGMNDSKELLESRWSSVQAIPEIQSKHYFRASSCYAGSIISGRTVKSELRLSEMWKDNEVAESNQSSERNEFETFPQSNNTTQRKRIRYSEVYSDSENEDQYLLAKHVSKNEVKAGQFILIELVSEKKGRRKKYVGITQSCVDKDDNVEVMYMNTVYSGTKSEQLFKIEHSKSYIVPFVEVCGVFKSPEIKETGNRIFYKFEKPIEL